MDFESSTQSKSWIFDEESLARCKEQASIIEEPWNRNANTAPRVRKFASGFASRRQQQLKQSLDSASGADDYGAAPGESAFRSVRPYETNYEKSLLIPVLQHGSPQSSLSASDQDILVHFHAHQIQRLVGPSALLPELQRSASVLSTAITLFRRFYLSNSVIDFHPRNVAAASALLAVKVDCEPKLEVSTVPCLKRSNHN